jgi:sugar-specific transcriptional regulator TrmB
MTERKSSVSNTVFFASDCGKITSTNKDYVELMDGKTKQYYFDNPSAAKKHLLLGGENMILNEYYNDLQRVFELTKKLSKELKKGNWNYNRVTKKILEYFVEQWEIRGYVYKPGLYSIIT